MQAIHKRRKPSGAGKASQAPCLSSFFLYQPAVDMREGGDCKPKECDSLVQISQEVGFQKIFTHSVKLVQTCHPESPLTPGQLTAKVQAWLRVMFRPPGADNKDTEPQRDGFYSLDTPTPPPSPPLLLLRTWPLPSSAFSLVDSDRFALGPGKHFLTLRTGPLRGTWDRGL